MSVSRYYGIEMFCLPILLEYSNDELNISLQSKWLLPFLHAEDVELLLDSKITLKVRMFFPLSSFFWFTNNK